MLLILGNAGFISSAVSYTPQPYWTRQGPCLKSSFPRVSFGPGFLLSYEVEALNPSRGWQNASQKTPTVELDAVP